MSKKENGGISTKNGLRLALGGFCGLLLTMDLTLWLKSHGHAHGHGPAWMGWPGFFFVFGILGAAALSLVAKLILFPMLKRDENYYDGKERDR
jgi:hypothetical protein